jgi:predicted DNA-binding protein YlxM (UPF0122 family)
MKYIQNICINCSHYKQCKEPCAFIEKLLNESEGLCDSCPHKSNCTKPCFLAESLLNADNKPFFERTTSEVQDGQEVQITVIYDPYGHHVSKFSEVTTEDEEGMEQSLIADITDEDMKKFYDGVFYVRNQRLGIFIDRFFNNISYEDLAVKYDTTVNNAMKTYNKAKGDFISFLDAWNREKDLVNNRKCAKAHIKDMGEMSKKMKCFLLYHCFGLSYQEISEVLKVPRQHISREIKLVLENVKQGANVLQYENGKIRASTPDEIRRHKNCQMA